MGATSFTLVRYLTTVLDRIRDGAILIGVEADDVFRLMLANKAFHEISGYGAECIGKDVGEFVNPARYNAIKKQLKKAVALNQSAQYVSWTNVPAGRRAFEAEVVPIPNSAGKVVQIMVLVRDITKYTKLKEEVESLRAASYLADSHPKNSGIAG